MVSATRDTLTVIMAGGQGQRLYPLTRDRAKPAVPFGGAYRIIDFALSNCLNSGLRRVFVLTQYKSLSLERHIRQGWSIHNEALGEFIVPLPPQQRLGGSWYQGTADALYQNIYTLERERPRHVLVLSGDHVYKMNYGKMIDFHISRGAALTVGCVEVDRAEAVHFGVAEVDADRRIVGFAEKPAEPAPIPGRESASLASMGIYVFDTKALVRRISQDAKRTSDHDFGKNVIPAMIDSDRVFAYPFEDENRGDEPYWRDIGRIEAYYEANMELLLPEPHFRLHDPRWPIWTHSPPAPPLKVVAGAEGEPGEVLASLIAPGVRVSGGRVVRCVIGRGSVVERGSEITDSIIMDNVVVGAGTRIRRAIVDKHVRIPAGERIGLDPEEDARRFSVSDEGIVLVPKELAF